MGIFILLFFVSLTLSGIEQRDWDIALLGAIPLVFAIIAASLQIYADRKLKKLQEQDPEIRKICRDIDRIKRSF